MLLFSLSLTAQSGYERIYRFSDETEHLTLDGQQTADGGYVFLSLVTERDSSTYHAANITKLSVKGNIEFSQDIVVEDSLELLPEGDLEFIPGDRMAITLTGAKDSLSQFVIVTNASAVPDWSRKYSIYQDSTDIDYYRPRLKSSQELDLSMYQAAEGLDNGIGQVYLSKIGIINGAQTWSKYLSKPGPNGTTTGLDFGDLTTCLEGGIAVAGVDDTTKEFFLSKIDTDGNIEWNQSITTTLVSSNSVVNSITQLPDSTYIIVGSYFTQNIEFDGFIIKTDSEGIVSWSKRVDFDFSFNDVHLLDVISSPDNSLLISAKQIGELDTAAIGLKLDLDGNVIWQSSFKDVSMEHVNLAGLSSANGTGMSFFCNGGNLIGGEQYTPYLIVTDSMGMTLCNDTIGMQIVFDATFDNDTLALEINDYLNTYDVDCCDDSFVVGDDRNNIPSRVKMFDGFTYVSAININSTGQRLATFSKIDGDDQVVWTEEFEVGTNIFDFEKINDTEFILVGSQGALSTTVDNFSFMIKMDDDGNITGGGTLNNFGRETLTQITLHPNPTNPLFPIYVGGYINYDASPSAVDQNLVFNIDEDFNINWVNNYNLDLQDSQFSRVSPLSNGNVVIYGDTKPASNGIIAELNGLNGDVVAGRATNDQNFFFEVEELPNGNLIAVGGVQIGVVWSATIHLLNADYEFLSGIAYDNGDINFFREVEFSSDGTMYVTGLTNDGKSMLNSYSIDNETITPLQSRVLELNDSNASYPYFDINGDMMAYGRAGSIINADSDIILFTDEISNSFFCFKERDVLSQSFTTAMDTVDISFSPDSLAVFEMETSLDIDYTVDDVCTQDFFSSTMILNVDETPFGNHQVPVLTLEVRPFCANEPLEWTFDATTPGATSYLWMDSEGEELGTADTLFVTETGVYNVIVTIGTDVCYTLCDTAELAVFEEPMVSIGVDTTSVCVDEFILTALPSALNETGIVSYEWSTNEMGEMIEVSDEGTYMVTAVDDCGIEAVASFDVIFDQPELNASITSNETPFCTDGTFILTATGDPLNETALVSYSWSPGGENTESITASQEIEYSVTVTDECGTTATASFTPVFPLLVEGSSIEFNVDDFCATQIATINAYYDITNPDGLDEIVFVLWSTGEDDFEITVTQPGTYSVTMTDFCQNQFVEQITIDELPQLAPEIVEEEPLCTEDGVRLTITSLDFDLSEYDISWSNGETNVSSIVVPFDADATYDVSVAHDCGADLNFTFEGKACTAEFDFPNAFIGNFNDPTEMGYNDGFGLVIPPNSEFAAEVDSYELTIYNRHGEKVFESTDYTEHWDGIYQEKNAPGDVYMYFAKVGFRNGVEETAKGDFTLLR